MLERDLTLVGQLDRYLAALDRHGGVVDAALLVGVGPADVIVFMDLNRFDGRERYPILVDQRIDLLRIELDRLASLTTGGENGRVGTLLCYRAIQNSEACADMS